MSYRRFHLLIGAAAAIIGFNAAGHAAAQTYTYDALGRLTSATHANGHAVTYSYDLAGNRTQVVSGTPSPTGPQAAADGLDAWGYGAGVYPTGTIDPRTNDTGGPLTVIAVTQPGNGSATFSAGTVTYTYRNRVWGTGTAQVVDSDAFTYTVRDSQSRTATATVNVNVFSQ